MTCRTPPTAPSAMRLIATAAPDVVILDLGLPDMDGKDIITRGARMVPRADHRALRPRSRDREDRRSGSRRRRLCRKALRIGELIARIRTALRHKAQDAATPRKFEVDGLVIDTLKRRVSRDGEPSG